MKTTIVYPKNKLLKKYIKYFLFITNCDPTYNKRHISYPNTNYCLGLYKGSKLINNSKYEYSIVQSEGYNSYLTGIYEKPLTFHFTGVFDEICIDFEPLGLEAITGYEISSTKFINSIIENLFSTNWQEIYSVAFRSDNFQIRAQLLEFFFINNIKKNLKFEFIPFNQIYEHKVNDLKEIYNLSYRSIHRLYFDKLGVSPKEFMDISRFRKSINHLKQKGAQAQVAYKNGYCDQSHFIRTFKNYTNLTPKKFIKDVNSINNEIWLAVK